MTASTIDNAKNQGSIKPNLLPCKIGYNGPVNATDRYWSIQEQVDGSKTAYFRGRKLQGKTVTLPDGYTGKVLQKTDRTIVDIPPYQPQHDDSDDELDGPVMPKEVKIIEQVGSFDAITVWGHEAVPLDAEDPYIKGVNEWIKLAEAIHNDV